jgi:hypothetical protein
MRRSRSSSTTGDDRWELLLALIQVAVGYHEAPSGHVGAARMQALGLGKLEPFATFAWGIDVGVLRGRVRDDLQRLERGATLDARLIETPPQIAVVLVNDPPR